ncbi:MAG: YtxH domain-containing protein [Syntrophaceae bacterium]|nr:YtxH domain-containing protein [Syntrophaceae bacterium]
MGNEERSHGTGSIILAFFIGGLVGAGVALLLAPQSGKETRQKIKELADEAKEKATHYAEEVKSKVTSTVEKGKELVEEKKSLISTALEAGKEAYTKEKEKLGKG